MADECHHKMDSLNEVNILAHKQIHDASNFALH